MSKYISEKPFVGTRRRTVDATIGTHDGLSTGIKTSSEGRKIGKPEISGRYVGFKGEARDRYVLRSIVDCKMLTTSGDQDNMLFE